MRVKTAQFAHEVEILLGSYSDEVQESLSSSLKSVANQCLNRIRDTSPHRFGDYAKGWRMKKSVQWYGRFTTYTIYNINYRLIHLLEFGHAKVNGGRVEAIPHVRPAAQAAERDLTNAVQAAIEKVS